MSNQDARGGSGLPGMAKVEVWAWVCGRCTHAWLPREKNRSPKVCPKCKSPYWDKPRRRAAPKSERVSKAAAK